MAFRAAVEKNAILEQERIEELDAAHEEAAQQVALIAAEAERLCIEADEKVNAAAGLRL